MIFENLRLIDDEIPRDGAWNMAIDEALCEGVAEPVLRIYRWSEPTVSFGYFEKSADVRARRPGVPAIRRWTGGGLVDHGQDFTYSLIVPAGHLLWSGSRAESYVRLHRGIQQVLMSQFGLAVDLATESTGIDGGCFERPVVGDLTLNGQKVAGAAQRRGRSFLLHQGSLQHLPLQDCETGLFASAWSEKIVARPLGIGEESRAKVLVASRYGSPGWHERY